MKNKTCGECKYFNGLAHGFCKNKQGRLSVQVNDPICQNYKSKPTNGDKIRQMSDEELAGKFGYPCPLTANKHCSGISNEECTECWLNWLKQEAKDE